MRALGIGDYKSYLEFIKGEPAELQLLLKTIPINLSYFYRNPEVFECFQRNVLPALNKKRQLSFWSAGCASGEEAYSIAIALHEALGDEILKCRIHIYGTDVDVEAIEQAEKGVYTDFALSYLPAELINRYFKKDNGNYEIVPYLKKYVQFYRIDLFEIPPFEKVDVIFCRNVLIYLAKEGQKEIIKIFHDKLKPTGFLILGKVEILLGITGFKVIDTRERIYQKITPKI